MSDAPSTRSRNGRVSWRLVLWVALAAYAILFALMNSDRQDVSFVFFTVKTRLVWLILLSMGIGVLLAMVGPNFWRGRSRG